MTENDLLEYGIIIPKKWDLEHFRYLVNVGYKVAIEDIRYDNIYLISNKTKSSVSLAFPNSIFNITNISSVNRSLRRSQAHSFRFIPPDERINRLMKINFDDPYFKYSKLKVLWHKFLKKIF